MQIAAPATASIVPASTAFATVALMEGLELAECIPAARRLEDVACRAHRRCIPLEHLRSGDGLRAGRISMPRVERSEPHADHLCDRGQIPHRLRLDAVDHDSGKIDTAFCECLCREAMDGESHPASLTDRSEQFKVVSFGRAGERRVDGIQIGAVEIVEVDSFFCQQWCQLAEHLRSHPRRVHDAESLHLCLHGRVVEWVRGVVGVDQFVGIRKDLGRERHAENDSACERSAEHLGYAKSVRTVRDDQTHVGDLRENGIRARKQDLFHGAERFIGLRLVRGKRRYGPDEGESGSAVFHTSKPRCSAPVSNCATKTLTMEPAFSSGGVASRSHAAAPRLPARVWASAR